jgi:serine O-acetyltransferase
LEKLIRAIFRLFFEAGFQAVLLYRTSRWFYLKRSIRLLAYVFSRFNLWFTGADIHPGSDLGRGLILPHPSGIVIGANVRMGEDCIVMQGVTLGALEYGLKGERHPRIGRRVKIYCQAKILGPVSVGDDSVIAAGALVTVNVPPASNVMNVNEIRPPDLEEKNKETFHNG